MWEQKEKQKLLAPNYLCHLWFLHTVLFIFIQQHLRTEWCKSLMFQFTSQTKKNFISDQHKMKVFQFSQRNKMFVMFLFGIKLRVSFDLMQHKHFMLGYLTAFLIRSEGNLETPFTKPPQEEVLLFSHAHVLPRPHSPISNFHWSRNWNQMPSLLGECPDHQAIESFLLSCSGPVNEYRFI